MLAIHPDGLVGYVTNFDSSTVAIVDMTTHTVTGLINDPDHLIIAPIGISITPDGTKAYVANYYFSDEHIGSVAIINLETQIVTGVIFDPDETLKGPDVVTFTPDGSKAFVPNTGFTTVSIIDVETDTVTATITDSGSTIVTPYDVAITPDGTKGYITNYYGGEDGTISIFDVETTTVTGIVDASDFPFLGPFLIAINNDGTQAFVSNYNGNAISIIDLSTDTVTSYVFNPNNLFAGPGGIAIFPDNKKLYVCNEASSDDIPDNSFVTVVLSGDGLFAPSDVIVKSIPNQFLTQTDLTNVITWKAPALGPTPIAYNLYSNAGLTKLIATIPANGPLQYVVNNIQPGKTYTYWLTSINQNDDQSIPAVISITSKLNQR